MLSRDMDGGPLPTDAADAGASAARPTSPGALLLRVPSTAVCAPFTATCAAEACWVNCCKLLKLLPASSPGTKPCRGVLLTLVVLPAADTRAAAGGETPDAPYCESGAGLARPTDRGPELTPALGPCCPGKASCTRSLMLTAVGCGPTACTWPSGVLPLWPTVACNRCCTASAPGYCLVWAVIGTGAHC